ncbi:hypothetical protein EKG37_02355, partial [Robertmurraya yapensis]
DVEYFDATELGKIDFSIAPFQQEIENTWLGEYYPNTTLSGNPNIIGGNSSSTKLSKLNLDWGNGTPHSSIPSDQFSARFTKKETFEPGVYLFEADSDDGIRVWVDDKIVIDSWVGSNGWPKSGKIALDGGEHTIKVEYFEGIGGAHLKLTYRAFPVLAKADQDVHYNWGYGSPVGFPNDYFMGVFDQSRHFARGDYFVQTFADDAVKVEVDGKSVIDRWDGTGYGTRAQSLLLGQTEGQHTVKTHYYENVGAAIMFSDIVPFDSWLAYYYENRDVAGYPTAAKVISPVGAQKNLYEDFGADGPVPGYKKDNFSAKYTTAKRLPAGEYILRTKADDGVRVYVDGKLVLDRWTNSSLREDVTKIQIGDKSGVDADEKDIHWIDVEYFDATELGKIDFSIAPFQQEIENTWLGEYYPNTTLSGYPYVVGGNSSASKISNIDFNWGSGSPLSTIPNDRFSARFTRTVNLESGTYLFTVNSDDGVRIKVDNKIVLDAWQNGDFNNRMQEAVYLESGEHLFEVEYLENIGDAKLLLNYQKLTSSKVFYDYEKQISYNWGSKGPDGFASDNFEAIFDQSQALKAGDYHIQTMADDGVRVEVDGQLKIDRLSPSGGQADLALLMNSQSKEYNIKTQYFEATGNAFIYSHVLPFGDWVAYYYPNTNLGGSPVGTKVIRKTEDKLLSDINNLSSPISGTVPEDNYSAVYRTAQRITSGQYIIRARADDGIRVYIDGALALDRWSSGSFDEDAVTFTVQDRNVSDPKEKDVHWIEVHYYEGTGNGNVELDIKPLNSIFNTDQWVGELFPTTDLTGNQVILGGVGSEEPIRDLKFNWGLGKPHNLIPADRFSARFTKKAHFNGGTYQIRTLSDDGIRVKVDGEVKIDSWIDSGTDYVDSTLYLGSGVHEIVVEYYDNVEAAVLDVEIVNMTEQSYKFVSAANLPAYRSFEELTDYRKHLVIYNPSYTRLFELEYGDSVKILEERQYAARILTGDGKEAWIQKDYLESDLLEDLWLVKDGRTLRSSSTTSSSNIGWVPTGAKVRILDYEYTPGVTHTEWYQVQTESGQRGWIWGAIATSGNSGFNLIKYEFHKIGAVTNDITLFTPLTTKSNVTAEQINRFIDYKTQGRKSVMKGMGETYIKAQEASGLNAIYLLAHSGHETAWGTSIIASSKYNFYGIGAIDSAPVEGALDYSTPEGGIILGAKWISDNYVIRSWDTDQSYPYYQPTLDNMKFDKGWHQYATDEAWGPKIVRYVQEFNEFIK